MISIDRGALICDLAETYGIYDYRSLPALTVATLSVGLRDDSRIKTKIRGGRAKDNTEVLIGHVYDRLNDILLVLGAYKKRPDSLAAILQGFEQKEEVKSFSSGEDFEKARNKLLREGAKRWQRN